MTSSLLTVLATWHTGQEKTHGNYSLVWRKFSMRLKKTTLPMESNHTDGQTTIWRLFGGHPHHLHQRCRQLLQQIPLNSSVASICTGKCLTVACTIGPNPSHGAWSIPSIFHRTPGGVWQKVISHQLHQCRCWGTWTCHPGSRFSRIHAATESTDKKSATRIQ